MNNLDETELARLEALAKHVLLPFETVMEYGVGCPSGDGPVPLQVCMTRNKYDASYIAAACNAVPTLVAEVRRLRSCKTINLADFEHHLKSAQAKEIESLREKVEAWEWFEEVRTYYLWLEHPYWYEYKELTPLGEVFHNAEEEYIRILNAAREAVC